MATRSPSCVLSAIFCDPLRSARSGRDLARPVAAMSESVASVDKDKKEKVKAMNKWLTTNMADLTPEVAKKYAKRMYDANVPTIEKLGKKLVKDPSFLRSSKLDIDEDDAKELVTVLSNVLGLSIGTTKAASAAGGGAAAAAAATTTTTTGAAAATAPGAATPTTPGYSSSSMAGVFQSVVAPLPAPVFLSLDFVAADRKEKAEEMIAWYRANTKDITVPNMHVYAYKLYDDNCATVTKIARKMERDPQYLHSMSFDPDDIREIVDSLKMLGMLKADFQPYDEKRASVESSAAAAAAAVQQHRPSLVESESASSETVQLLEVDSSPSAPQLPFEWGQEVVGLVVSIFSEETRTWLEGRIVRYDATTKCHDVRFPDNFELDVDLNASLIRIESCALTLGITGALEQGPPVQHRALRSSFIRL